MSPEIPINLLRNGGFHFRSFKHIRLEPYNQNLKLHMLGNQTSNKPNELRPCGIETRRIFSCPFEINLSKSKWLW